MKKEDKSTSFHLKRPIEFNGKKLTFDVCRIMGILNVTPDSFYDGGKFIDPEPALRQTEKMIGEGADIIDIGAVSTRPGAAVISRGDEVKRLTPILLLIRKHFPDIFISIDTFFSETARIAIDMGADMINDISGGNYDPQMIPFITMNQVPYVIMHIQGTPRTMQDDPHYDDVVGEVKTFLFKRAGEISRQGYHPVVIDPGFGFGKTMEHNYQLLKNLDTFQKAGYPVMAGLSRKSMVNRILKVQPEAALNGSTILHTLALLKGVDILRVHDVKEAKEAVQIVSYFNQPES